MLGGRRAMSAIDWIKENKEWLFSGLGVALLTLIVAFVRRRAGDLSRAQHQSGGTGSQNMQAGRDINISLDASYDVAEKQGLTEGEDALLASLPKLISEMRSYLLGPQAEFVREFFVLPNRSVPLGVSSKPRFIYYEDEHQNLRGQLDVLEEHGFVVNVTPVGNRTPIYRMTERLVTQLRK